MKAVTPASLAAREAIDAHRGELEEILRRYGARNPRLFGSVARGEADGQSDIDVLVDLDPPGERVLMRLGGLTEGFRRTLQHPVDVVAPSILRPQVSETALADAIPL